jgi:hypothetical protein
MSHGRASPLAATFLWAAGIAGAYGLVGAVTHEKPEEIVADMTIAASAAAIVAYRERKDALWPE